MHAHDLALRLNRLLHLEAILAIVATAITALALTSLHALLFRACLVLQISFIGVVARIPRILLVLITLLLLVVELLGEDVLREGLLARADDLLSVETGGLRRSPVYIIGSASWFV